jgi:hypothetical protein
MKNISTFSTWDIINSSVDLNDGYPYLAWQNNTETNRWLIYQEPNMPPNISNENPANNSINQSLSFTWNCTITDPNGNTFNWSITCNNSQSNSANDDTNGNKTLSLSGLAENTEYIIWVNATDGNSWTRKWFNFTTANYEWSEWSSWWEITYSVCVPTNFVASAYSNTVINLTWTNCGASADRNVLVRNDSGWTSYPLTPTNGTVLDNGTNTTFNDTGLVQGITYYYAIWGYNTTGHNYSISSGTTYNRTFSEPVITLQYPTPNATGNWERTPVCKIWANDTDGNTLTVTWQENTTGSWVTRNINSSVSANSTVGYKFTQFSVPLTTYWFIVYVNDGTTNVSKLFNFTTQSNIAPYITFVSPANGSFEVGTTPQTSIYAQDNNSNILTICFYENTSVPGTWTLDTVYAGYSSNATYTFDYLEATGVYTRYWWLVTVDDSVANTSAIYWFNTSNMSMFAPYPANQSGEVVRPPANLSISITATNVDLSIWFINMTSVTNTWTKLYEWTGVNTGRYEVTSLSSLNGTTQFIWGNTTYYWSANLTDGSSWINTTYNYTTTEVVDTKSLRYDVSNDGAINVLDLSIDWAHNWLVADYNRLYDTNVDTIVNVIDLSKIWANNNVG